MPGGGELYKHIWHSPLGSGNKDLSGPKVTEKIEVCTWQISRDSLIALFSSKEKKVLLVASHFLCRVGVMG